MRRQRFGLGPGGGRAWDDGEWEGEIGDGLPYIYIDKVLNELRDELLTAMHAAVDRELRQGRVDVAKLYRAFTRAAANQVSNPVLVSDKCVELNTARPKRGSKVKAED